MEVLMLFHQPEIMIYWDLLEYYWEKLEISRRHVEHLAAKINELNWGYAINITNIFRYIIIYRPLTIIEIHKICFSHPSG